MPGPDYYDHDTATCTDCAEGKLPVVVALIFAIIVNFLELAGGTLIVLHLCGFVLVGATFWWALLGPAVGSTVFSVLAVRRWEQKRTAKKGAGQ